MPQAPDIRLTSDKCLSGRKGRKANPIQILFLTQDKTNSSFRADQFSPSEPFLSRAHPEIFPKNFPPAHFTALPTDNKSTWALLGGERAWTIFSAGEGFRWISHLGFRCTPMHIHAHCSSMHMKVHPNWKGFAFRFRSICVFAIAADKGWLHSNTGFAFRYLVFGYMVCMLSIHTLPHGQELKYFSTWNHGKPVCTLCFLLQLCRVMLDYSNFYALTSQFLSPWPWLHSCLERKRFNLPAPSQPHPILFPTKWTCNVRPQSKYLRFRTSPIVMHLIPNCWVNCACFSWVLFFKCYSMPPLLDVQRYMYMCVQDFEVKLL